MGIHGSVGISQNLREMVQVCMQTLHGYGFDGCRYGVVQPDLYYTHAEPYIWLV